MSLPDSMVPQRSGIDSQVRRIALVVLLGPLMTSLDSTVVNVSLSTLVRELRVPLNIIQWVITGYLLALALMLPLSGWLVDRIGAKRVYLSCFSLFTIASLLCGISTTAPALIASRALQGMAGGLLAPMAQMMLAHIAGRNMARLMGFISVPVLLGPVFGVSLAGIVLQHATWCWIFFINLPIGLLAIVLAARILPKDAASTRTRGFDLPGFLLLSPALVLLLYSLEALAAETGERTLHLFELVFAVAMLVCFLFHARRRGRSALVDLDLFRDAAFSASARTQFLTNGLLFGGQMLTPLYLLTVRHYPPERAGFLLTSAGLGMIVSYSRVGRLAEQFGPRRVSTAGAVLALVGTAPFVLPSFATAPIWTLVLALFVRGAGLGSIGIPSLAAAYSTIEKADIPIATTAINIVQRLGGPVATTVLAIFLHSRMAGAAHVAGSFSDTSRLQAFTSAYWLFCAIHAATIIAAVRLPWRTESNRGNRRVATPSLESATE